MEGDITSFWAKTLPIAPPAANRVPGNGRKSAVLALWTPVVMSVSLETLEQIERQSTPPSVYRERPQMGQGRRCVHKLGRAPGMGSGIAEGLRGARRRGTKAACDWGGGYEGAFTPSLQAA